MSLRSDPLDRLAIPDGTTVEEHDLVADGDVVIGGQSTIEFGVRGRNVIAGERVRFGGDIEAEADCRLDMWCDVAGNVLVGQDAYLGERVHVGGQLIVSGDLDIGDDVDIEDGFEANGWIVIRNPMPTIVFLFVYLSQLLRMGEQEAAESLWDDVTREDRDHDPVLIPRSARVSDDAWRVSTPATVGDDCRLHGNIRAKRLTVGRDNEIFGSLRAKGDLAVERGTVIHGDVTTRGGTVRIDAGVHVRGDVSCEDLELDDDAEVDGAIRARGEVSIVRSDGEEAANGADGDADSVEESAEAASDAEPESDDDSEPIPAIVRVDAEDDEEREEPIPAIVRVDDQDGEGNETDESSDDADAAEIPEIPDAEETAANDAPASEDGLAGAIAEAEER
ncbi:polymer-forming cytoskeletal protein [Halorarius litoreus]|uniref:polymer-forming cytoskeletal protein n=1 Tax=Halorarius litoreus TaxID=2962676 RepID=UPI0020CE88D0|nr:polymer-forming cytoskeletal protein [Halorarius litoreus]